MYILKLLTSVLKQFYKEAAFLTTTFSATGYFAILSDIFKPAFSPSVFLFTFLIIPDVFSAFKLKHEFANFFRMINPETTIYYSRGEIKDVK